MFRLNLDGSVDEVDDTPDPEYMGDKYMKSSMREDRWVFIGLSTDREYIDDVHVPQIIKMFHLLVK